MEPTMTPSEGTFKVENHQLIEYVKMENKSNTHMQAPQIIPNSDSRSSSQQEVNEIEVPCETTLIDTEESIEEFCVSLNPEDIVHEELEPGEFIDHTTTHDRFIVEPIDEKLVKEKLSNRCDGSTELKSMRNKVGISNMPTEVSHCCHHCDFSKVNLNLKDTDSPVEGGHWIFFCQICRFSTTDKLLLVSHLEKLHAYIGKKCDGCNFMTDRICRIRQHIITAHLTKSLKLSKLKCDKCENLSITAELLRRHIEKNHLGVRTFNCALCSFSATKQYQLNGHVDECHPPPPDHYKCEKCNYATSREASLLLHIDYKHNENKKHKCNQCDFETRGRGELLTHKKKVHLGVEPYKCKKCDFSTFLKSALEKHVKTKHTEDVGHTGKRKNILRTVWQKCSKCDASFMTKSSLLKHHADKHFRCSDPQKSESSEFSTTLENHARNEDTGITVNNESNNLRYNSSYQCIKCDFSTCSESMLNKHLQIVHYVKCPKSLSSEQIESWLKCQYCEAAFKKEGNLKKHLKNRHPSQNP